MVLADTMRRTISERNPDVPVRASTMEATLETASAAPRFQTFLLVVFAGVALLLALAGVYGVMAYTVSQRVPELGVRIALGATPENIRALILRPGRGARRGRPRARYRTGAAVGPPAAGLSVRRHRDRSGSSSPAVIATVAVATLAACYIPVRRAVRVDPMVALRAE